MVDFVQKRTKSEKGSRKKGVPGLPDTSGIKVPKRTKLITNFTEKDTLSNRIKFQQWPGLCIAFIEGKRRCVVATQKFEKDDILMDYHGKTEHPPNNISFFDFYKEYVKRTDVVQEYVLEVKGINGISTRRLIDATQDKCTKKYHASKRCPGCLTNHTNAENTADDANMKIDEIQVFTTTETHVVFKARRAIEPFERLRWNY